MIDKKRGITSAAKNSSLYPKAVVFIRDHLETTDGLNLHGHGVLFFCFFQVEKNLGGHVTKTFKFAVMGSRTVGGSDLGGLDYICKCMYEYQYMK